MLFWQHRPYSAEVGDERVKVSMVSVRYEARGNFSMPVTYGQNTTVTKAGRKGLFQFSQKSFISPLMRAHNSCPSEVFKLNELKIELVQDLLPPLQLYTPLFLLCL